MCVYFCCLVVTTLVPLQLSVVGSQELVKRSRFQAVCFKDSGDSDEGGERVLGLSCCSPPPFALLSFHMFYFSPLTSLLLFHIQMPFRIPPIHFFPTFFPPLPFVSFLPVLFSLLYISL